MNKTAIRNFAIWARNKLLADVSYSAGLMGITKNGISQALPQSTNDVEFYDIGAADPFAILGETIQQRKSLVNEIRQKEKESNYEAAYDSVMEEVAYTWFNRFIAIRFMEVNDYLPEHVRVLSSESGKQEPDIVTTPFDAGLFFTGREKQEIIQMKNDNKLDEVFRILFIKQCRDLSRILPRLFEGTNDYTELLLNVSFIDKEGVIYHLVHDIPEDDFNVENEGQEEIIGWLYQYYIAEQKDLLINAHKKYKKQDIPFVTQLFTPEWIVRYMVDNSLGRLWIEGHSDDPIISDLDFYLETSDFESISEDLKQEHSLLRPQDIRIIDPCVGSGHILVYAFDVLMSIYRNAGWSDREAAQSIIENNLYGVDIDGRAGQIAYFSVLMKARRYNRGILNTDVNCHVFSLSASEVEVDEFKEMFNENELETIKLLLDDFKIIKEIGSLICLSVSYNQCYELYETINAIRKTIVVNDVFDFSRKDSIERKLKPIVEQALVLLDEYDVVVTNPPYMNSSQMPDLVKKYLAKEYSDFKNDLFSAFLFKASSMCKQNGHIGLLMPYVWMFISSYEKMRIWLNDNVSITSLVQLEYNAFEAACVPVAALTICKSICNSPGEYIKLSEFKGVENQEPKTREAVKNKDCGYRYSTKQNKFKNIPGQPIAFWASDSFVDAFSNKSIDDFCTVTNGLFTCNNNLFLRLWYEPSYSDISTDCDAKETCEKDGKKWYPYNKGGDFRRWYGNHDYVVFFQGFGGKISQYRVKNGQSASFPGQKFYFKPSIAWSLISSSKVGIRFYPKGFVFDIAGSSIFPDEDDNLNYILGLMASEVAAKYLQMINPTINYQVGDVRRVPAIFDDNRRSDIEHMVTENIKISRADWDSYESSWNFKRHPLV